jgi:hypothetical protein
MGAVKVHEFTSLDGVIDAPTWTFDYGFDPKMGEARTNDLPGIRAGLVAADGRGRSGRTVFQRHRQICRLGDAHHHERVR